MRRRDEHKIDLIILAFAANVWLFTMLIVVRALIE